MKISNIYHCCVYKTGSQWIKAIFSDNIIFKKTGFDIFTYQQQLNEKIDKRKLTERVFDRPFPLNSIISPLYMDYKSFDSIPKPPDYRAFFIMRDPRDIVISWYYSARQSHPPVGKILLHRKNLNKLTLLDGLKYSIKYLEYYGLFKAIRSWIDAERDNPMNKVFRYEEITDVNKQELFLSELFKYCGICMNENELKELLVKYRFSAMRNPCNANNCHYRKGIPGNGEYILTTI